MSLTRRTLVTGTLTASVAALLAACSGTTSTSTTGATTTVEHAFGTTEVPATVTRVASVNWGNQDVALALGVMPVGMAKQTWGVEDGSGMLAWTKEKVDELVAAGAEQPVLFDETDAIDFEAVSATKPDVILAAYSGLTKEDYETLSAIAPTIAYKDFAWGTAWRDMITLDAAGMGKAEEGAALVADLEKQVADAVAAYPAIKGKAAAFFFVTPQDMSSIGFYTPGDPRTGFLADLGMTVPASVQKAADADPTTFFASVAAENADTLSDVEVMVMYGEDKDLAALQADPLLGTIPAIKNGAVALIGNGTPLSASTNPGPLSIPWGITEYTALLGAAAAKAA